MEKNNKKRLAGENKREKKPRRLTRQQKILIAVAVVLTLAVVIVAACQSLFVKPTLPVKGEDDADDQKEKTEEIDYGEGIRPRADGERKSEDFYTILVLGRDTGGGGNTDTMLLASYDVTNQKATVMSIPRDTMVNVSWDVKKINSVYNGYGGGEEGIQGVYKEIAQLVGFEPDFQVVVEWEAVGKLVDAIGGVYFDVPYPMSYHDPYQDLVIEQPQGYRLLDGDDAMQVIRWRKNDAGSPYGYSTGIGDSGRMELQQDFLKAVIEQLLKPANVLNIGKIAKVFQENVETDLSFQNILWFGQQAVSGGLSVEDVNFVTMPYKGASAYSRTYSKQLGRDYYLSYVVPIARELLEIVNSSLSPYVEEFTISDLDIMSVNADGSLSSTTGYVEDRPAASAPNLMGSGSGTSGGGGEVEQPEYIVDEYGNIVDSVTGEIIVPAPGPETPGDAGQGGGTTGQGGETTDQGGGTTDQGGGTTGQGGGTTDQGGGAASQGSGITGQGGGTTGQGGGTASQGSGTTDQGSGTASQGGGTTDQSGGTTGQEQTPPSFTILPPGEE